MKLASLRNGRPDGQLVVVSKDLTHYASAGKIVPHLQAALDDWERVHPQLERLSAEVNARAIVTQAFHPAEALAPLPRAYQWIDGAGYLGHLERVRGLQGSKDAGLETAKPLLYQGGSDTLAGAQADIVVPKADMGVDFEAELVVVTLDVPMAATREEARNAIVLFGLCNDVSLRKLVAGDLQDGFGFFHAKPSTSFGPVFVTADELDGIWDGRRVSARVDVDVRGEAIGRLNAGEGMSFDFPDLVAAATETRALGRGTIVGSGTISNPHDDILPLKKGSPGFGCIAEARTAEKMKLGKARTGLLDIGESVRIEAFNAANQSVFGAISQTVRLKE